MVCYFKLFFHIVSMRKYKKTTLGLGLCLEAEGEGSERSKVKGDRSNQDLIQHRFQAFQPVG